MEAKSSVAEPLSEPVERRIVALLLKHGNRLCLLRRSALVRSDVGMWHCVTGFLEADVEPENQALAELSEETGLIRQDLRSFSAGPVLRMLGADGEWTVHVFVATSKHRRIRLNWEHDDVCWVPWASAEGDGRALVPWLSTLVGEVGSQAGRLS
ncbi:NUDIX domain-containing protein [Rhodococcus sp. C26F]